MLNLFRLHAYVITVAILLVSISFANAQYPAKTIKQKYTLPDSLTLLSFTKLINEISESQGVFHSDNFVSNESSYLHPISVLRHKETTGGVYLGVGPEQNYSYIAEIKPRIAFIVDIRRQNMTLHLLYKALFELSDTRFEFLSKLLSKDIPKNPSFLDKLFQVVPSWYYSNEEPNITEMVDYLDTIEPDEMLFFKNLNEIKAKLKLYGFPSPSDLESVEYIYRAFYRRGLDIHYDIQAPYLLPNLRKLLVSTTNDGEYASFLAQKESFDFVKNLHLRNLIIPVVGDFSGEKAIRGVSKFVRSFGGKISVFYTSNVELYLSVHYDLEVEYRQRDKYKFMKYFENVLTLPIDESSVFIRSYHNGSFARMMYHPKRIGDHGFTSIVQSISEFKKDKSWRDLRGYDRYIHITTTGIIE